MFTSARSLSLLAALLVLFGGFLYSFNAPADRFVYQKPTDLSSINFERAKIVKVLKESVDKHKTVEGLYRGSQLLEVEILSGEHQGELHTVKNYLSDLFNVHGTADREIIVTVDTAEPGNYRTSVYNYYRAPAMYLLIALFLFAIWIIGGKKGMQAITGLVFTFVCIFFLFIPLLSKGYSPVFSSILTVVLTTFVTLFSLNGWSAKTFAAVLGTALGVLIAGIISVIFGRLAHISGFNTPEAESLIVIASYTHIKVADLLFAGILISSLGAVMDVAMSIASSVYEIHTVNPQRSRKELFASGMNVGRDMMGTMANTLLLAYTGASVNAFIIIYSYNVQYNKLMNMNETCIEIIQGVSGSIAIVLTVPIVSFIASSLIAMLKDKKPLLGIR